MSTVVLVEPIASGVGALDSITAAGHRAVVLHSPVLDYMVTDEQRQRMQTSADLVIVADLLDMPAVLAALTESGTPLEDIVGVCTPAHLCIEAAARLAAELGLPHTAPEVLAATRDKALCRELLDAAGVPNLAHGIAANVADAVAVANRIGYPVIVKPSFGAGKTQTAVASTDEDIRALFAADHSAAADAHPILYGQLDGRFVIEEFAVGELYSVEVAFDGQRWTPLIAIRRKVGRDNPILELGSTVPCGLSTDEEAELGDYAVQACRAVGLGPGVFHVEVIATQAGPRLVEINPRMAGGAIPDLVAAATGHNLFDFLIDISVGRPAPENPLPRLAAVSHSFIAVTEDCTVRADLPENWFDTYRSRIDSGASTIQAGSQLRHMSGNFQVYGVVRVVAEDPRSAEEQCARLIAEIGDDLGVPMVPVARLERA